MLRIFFVFVTLVSFFGGANLAAGDVFPGKIVIYPDHQTIQFPIVAGKIQGLATNKVISAQDIKKIVCNSDRVGWLGNSICSTESLQPDGSCVMNGTVNNDTRVLWSVELKTGEVFYFNFDPANGTAWEVTSTDPNAPQPRFISEPGAGGTTAYFVEYGVYTKSSIVFDCRRRQASIKFACNLLIGLVPGGINPSNIRGVQWSSDAVGWKGNSTATGALYVSGHGNLKAVVNNMPRADIGFFTFLLKDGTYIWLNTSFAWQFEGADKTIRPTDGAIQYKCKGAAPPPAALMLLLGQ